MPCPCAETLLRKNQYHFECKRARIGYYCAEAGVVLDATSPTPLWRLDIAMVDGDDAKLVRRRRRTQLGRNFIGVSHMHLLACVCRCLIAT